MSSQQARLNAEQVDRLLQLTRRQLAQREATALSCGVTQAEINTVKQATYTPLKKGGTFPLPDGTYQLAAISDDAETFTLTMVDPGWTDPVKLPWEVDPSGTSASPVRARVDVAAPPIGDLGSGHLRAP